MWKVFLFYRRRRFGAADLIALMEGILTLVEGMGRFMAAIGVSSSVIFFGYAGFLFMSSGGDPNKQAQARTAFMGVVVGLVVLGMAFAVPGVVSEIVIVPAGGVAARGGVPLNDCDGLLRRHLVSQRYANSAYRMNRVVDEVQGRYEACDGDLWAPEVVKVKPGSGYCGRQAQGTQKVASIGALQFPPGLLTAVDGHGLRQAVGSTRRDSVNNMVIYFNLTARPWDGSACWVYFARFDTWRMG